jgi:hypothetical protein
VTNRMHDKSERHLHDGTPTDYCESCRKYTYISRAAARKRRKRGDTTRSLNAYRCPDGRGWHLGHLRDHEHSRDHHRAQWPCVKTVRALPPSTFPQVGPCR